MNEKLPYQEQKIDVDYHVLNFVRAMTNGNDPTVGRFHRTGRMTVKRGSLTPLTVDINSTGFYDCHSYYHFLWACYDGRDRFLEALSAFLENSPGATAAWNHPTVSVKWEEILELTLKEVDTRELLAKAGHELFSILQELGVYCVQRGSSFSYFQWSMHERQYIPSSKEAIRITVADYLYARIGCEKTVAVAMKKLSPGLVEHRQVDHSGYAMAGFDAGINELPNGHTYLAVKRPSKRVEPVEGACDLVFEYLRSRFCDEQLPYLLGWLSQCVKKLYAADRADVEYLTQAAVFMGEPGVGKSMFQEMFLNALFWGRGYNFSKGLSGESKYTDGRRDCEYLYVGDFSPPGNMKPQAVRDRITDMLKDIVANYTYTTHERFMAGMTLWNKNILTITTNMESKNVSVWPDVEDASAAGKIHMFVFGPTGKDFVMSRWKEMLQQLPQFIHWLRSWDIGHEMAMDWYVEGKDPKDMKVRLDERFGVASYIHPLALELIRDTEAQADEQTGYDDQECKYMLSLLTWLDSRVDWLKQGMSVALLHKVICREVEIPGVELLELQRVTNGLSCLVYKDVLRAGRGRLSLPGLLYTSLNGQDVFKKVQLSLDVDMDMKKTRGVKSTS